MFVVLACATFGAIVMSKLPSRRSVTFSVIRGRFASLSIIAFDPIVELRFFSNNSRRSDAEFRKRKRPELPKWGASTTDIHPYDFTARCKVFFTRYVSVDPVSKIFGCLTMDAGQWALGQLNGEPISRR